MAKAKRTSRSDKLVDAVQQLTERSNHLSKMHLELGSTVNGINSRVTGEIKALRERIKAGEKRAEPVEYLQEKVQSLAELVRGNSAGNKVLLNDILDQQVRTRDCAFSKIEALEERLSKLEDKLNDVLVQALKRIEEMVDEKQDETDLKQYAILWRTAGHSAFDPPNVFVCYAENESLALVEFYRQYPGSTVIYLTLGNRETVWQQWVKDREPITS